MYKHPFLKRIAALLLSVGLLLTLLPAAVSAKENFPLTVWDMEHLPADLKLSGLVQPLYPDTADYQAGNVSFTAAAGKGVQSSTALAIKQVGAENWSDIFYVYPERDASVRTVSLADADTLWFWIDASSCPNSFGFEFEVNGSILMIGETVYTARSGETAQATRLETAWGEQEYARLRIPARFTGWVGVPLTSFTVKPDYLGFLRLGLCGVAVGTTVYLDALTLCAGTQAPAGIQVSYPQRTDVATLSDPILDMEALPEDLIFSSLASASTSTLAVRTVDGKGFLNSRAMMLQRKTAQSSGDTVLLRLSDMPDFASDWRNGDMLMLWVDAREYAGVRVGLDFILNGSAFKPDIAYYTEREGLLVKAGAASAVTVGSDTFGRITLPEGFRGWLGLPLTGFVGIHDAKTMKLNLTYTGGSDLTGRALYLDDLRLTSGNAMPAGTACKNSEPALLLNGSQSAELNHYFTADVSAVHQTVAAYGASDCWWTAGIGERSNIDEAMRLLFGKDGIALNNYRINVGSGTVYSLSDAPMYFSRAARSPLCEDGSLDLTRNKGGWNALCVLRELIASGDAQIDDFTLFMNSPPSTMTDNGLSCSGRLRDDCYDDYAEYIADVTSAYEKAGIDIKYVSPVNEPLATWWQSSYTQECCVYSTAQQLVSVFEQTIDALAARGLDTKISVADFNDWNMALNNYDEILSSDKIAANIDHISGHDYGTSVSAKRSITSKAAADGLSIHQTEWAMSRSGNEDTMDTALELALTLHTDLTVMNTDTWSWWLGVGGGGCSDALIYMNLKDSIYETTKRLWAMGNYSRFTVGAKRVDALTSHLPDGITVSAFTKDNSLIYVLVNENTSDTMVSAAGLPAGSLAKMYVTSEEYNCEMLGTVTAERGITLPAYSVTTLVFSDLDLSKVRADGTPVAAGVSRLLDMENLPQPVFPGFANSWSSTLVSADAVAGAGYAGSTALGFHSLSYIAADNWSANLLLFPAQLGVSDWSHGDTLWFWIDLHEYPEKMGVELALTGKNGKAQQAVNSSFYLWNSSNGPTVSTAPDAWGGSAGFGRMPLPQGYTGFVGVPLADMKWAGLDSISEVLIYFDVEPNKDALPATMYLDEFWLTTGNSLPPVASNCAHAYLFPAAQLAATCTEGGKTGGIACADCGKLLRAQSATQPLGHNFVSHAAKAATCTEPGWSAYETCSRCDYTTYQQTDALGHDLITDAAVAATCTEAGKTAGSHCSRCDYKVAQEPVNALGHDFVRHAAKNATCSESGWSAYETCSRCDYTTYRQTEALGHDLITDAAVAATCTEAGKTAGRHCSRCDYKVAQETVNALGHSWDNGKVTTVPTTSAEGVRTYTCSRCGETKTEAIAKLTVTFTDVDSGSFYAKAVDWAVAGNITKGTGATTFSPEATCTRGQVVTFLWRAAGEPTPMRMHNPFTDVKSGTSYYTAVLWAVENGITAGTSSTTFSPSDGCTRGQVVTFLWRFEKKPAPKSTVNPFTDVTGSAFYYNAVLWAAENGITTGTSKTTFSPDTTCTRGQIVTFLWRDLAGK